MSDGITEARRGTYWKTDKYNHDNSIINWELHQKLMEQRKNYNHDDSIKTWNTTSTNGQTTMLQEPHKDIQFKHMPNQKWHKYVSFIKSGVRILGYGLIPFNLVAATLVLIFSEVIGIVEELV
jgi:hypothetical protein